MICDSRDTCMSPSGIKITRRFCVSTKKRARTVEIFGIKKVIMCQCCRRLCSKYALESGFYTSEDIHIRENYLLLAFLTVPLFAILSVSIIFLPPQSFSCRIFSASSGEFASITTQYVGKVYFIDKNYIYILSKTVHTATSIM